MGHFQIAHTVNVSLLNIDQPIIWLPVAIILGLVVLSLMMRASVVVGIFAQFLLQPALVAADSVLGFLAAVVRLVVSHVYCVYFFDCTWLSTMIFVRQYEPLMINLSSVTSLCALGGSTFFFVLLGFIV